MRDDPDKAMRDVERIQEQLKRNIEESARLIGQAQDAIQRHRDSVESKSELA